MGYSEGACNFIIHHFNIRILFIALIMVRLFKIDSRGGYEHALIGCLKICVELLNKMGESSRFFLKGYGSVM